MLQSFDEIARYLMKSATEVEVKIPLADRAGVQKRLDAAGFKVSVPRQFESNALYDTNDQSLRQKGMLFRLRELGDEAVLTWKGLGQPGVHKSRPELETSVGSAETFRRILEQLGYALQFRYEKYRVEYVDGINQKGVVTVDETPIGDFLEIEGPAEWIDSTAVGLGFSEKDYIVDSYGKLYLDYCKANGLEPGNMVFVPIGQKNEGYK